MIWLSFESGAQGVLLDLCSGIILCSAGDTSSTENTNRTIGFKGKHLNTVPISDHNKNHIHK